MTQTLSMDDLIDATSIRALFADTTEARGLPGKAYGADFYTIEQRERWCQSNANQTPNLQMMRISRRQLTPFGQRGSAIFFEGFAAVEVTFEIEMIVDRGMNGSELLQSLHVPKF